MFHPIHPLQPDEISLTIESLNLKPIEFGSWTQRSLSTIRNQILDSYKLILMKNGSFKLSWGSSSLSVNEHDLILIPPYLAYTAECLSQEPVTYYYIQFTCDMNESVLIFPAESIAYLPDFSTVKRLRYLQEAERALKNHEAGAYTLVLFSLMRYLILFLEELEKKEEIMFSSRTSTREHQIVASCIAYLNEQIHEIVKVADLCEYCSVSQSYLYRCFQKELGHSPQAVILNHKLKRSSLQLVSTHKSIEEIAYEFGFTSVYRYSTIFKSKYGVSPTQFKKQFQLK